MKNYLNLKNSKGGKTKRTSEGEIKYPKNTKTNKKMVKDANTITKQKMIEELGLEAGFSMEYIDLVKGPKKEIWQKSCGNELGRLAQGMKNRVKGTNTIFFIPKNKLPKNKIVTYTRIVCDIRPNKPYPFRTRIIAGGNFINYPGKISTPTAELTTVKTFANRIIFTSQAKAYGIDIKNLYLPPP